jgi:hypothetical protein
VIVEGFAWAKEPMTIGIAGLTGRRLCQRHNSLLHPLDSEAAVAFRALWRGRMRTGGRFRYAVDAGRLERWAAKTTVNLAVAKYASSFATWPGGNPIASPPPDLVRWIFGRAERPQPCGLYLRCEVGQMLAMSETIGWQGLFSAHTGRRVAGVLVGGVLVAGRLRFAGLESVVVAGREWGADWRLSPEWGRGRYQRGLKRLVSKDYGWSLRFYGWDGPV